MFRNGTVIALASLAYGALIANCVPAAAEEYQRVTNGDGGLSYIVQLSLRSATQDASCTGDLDGKVDFIGVGGGPLELETKDIIHEDNKAWIVTKLYGKIRVSGGYAGNYPGGMCLWLTPSQQEKLKRLASEKR